MANQEIPDDLAEMKEHKFSDMEGHEHPEPFFPEAVVVPQVFSTIRQAVAMGGDSGTLERYEQPVRQLEQEFAKLEWLVLLARRLVHGDQEAQLTFRTFLQAYEAGAEAFGATATERSLGGLAGEVPATEQAIFNVTPVTDLLIGAAYDARQNTELLGRHTATLQGLITGNALPLHLFHIVAQRVIRDLEPPTTLLTLLEEFGRGRDLSDLFDVELQNCLGAIFSRGPQVQGTVSRWEEYTTEQTNNGRITGVTPKDVCAGQSITISADPASPFDASQPSDVGVVFACGPPVTQIGWAPTAVTATVPDDAESGPVYFVRILSAQEQGQVTELAGSVMGELNDIMASCPLFFGSAGYGRGGALLDFAQGIGLRCPALPPLFPDGRNVIQVRHKPNIEKFVALDASNRAIGAEAIEACTPVTVQWNVVSDDVGPPQVELASQSGTLANLPAAGSAAVPQPITQSGSVTLRATNRCGTSSQVLIVTVVNKLRLTPAVLRLTPGQTRQVTVASSCPGNASVTLASSDPARVSVSSPVQLTNGAGVATLTATSDPGVLSGLMPMTAAAVITATAAGYELGRMQVWIEPPEGLWRLETRQLDMVPVHAALMPSGLVLFFSWDETDILNINKGKAQLWDPRTGPVTPNAVALGRNLFCAGHCVLPDGRLLVAGGQSGGGGGGVGGGADKDIHTFNPWGSTIAWTRHAPMPAARWYPTCVTLADGKALIAAGASSRLAGGVLGANNDEYEIFDPQNGTLTAPRRFHPGHIALYPFLKLLPDGSADGILFVHSRNETRLFHPQSNTWESKHWHTVSPHERTYPHQGSCAVLPILPGDSTVRIMVVGGLGNPRLLAPDEATSSAEIFDYDRQDPPNSPGWRRTRHRDLDPTESPLDMANQRFMSDAMLLPDGTVLVVNGAARGASDTSGNSVLMAEVFDPETETWSAVGSQSRPRHYHSVGLLVPDGRVVVAGNTWEFNPGNQVDDKTVEVFSPAYLFRGPRPSITQAPGQVGYAVDFEIETPEAQAIESVMLIRQTSVTHTNNMDQRAVGLAIVQKDPKRPTVLKVKSPPNATTAPPGYYLLFIVAGQALSDRIPSVGKFIRIG
jgi:hypothetical protein